VNNLSEVGTCSIALCVQDCWFWWHWQFRRLPDWRSGTATTNLG